MTCCCGRIDCALLKKNCSILETVEKDVHTAAQLGQVSQNIPILGHSYCFIWTVFPPPKHPRVPAYQPPLDTSMPHQSLTCLVSLVGPARPT
jgi:hypothetical protein